MRVPEPEGQMSLFEDLLVLDCASFIAGPALRLMGFGKTAANSAASRRVSCEADFLK